MAKFCAECANPITDKNAKFCSKCGAALPITSLSMQPTIAQPTEIQQPVKLSRSFPPTDDALAVTSLHISAQQSQDPMNESSIKKRFSGSRLLIFVAGTAFILSFCHYLLYPLIVGKPNFIATFFILATFGTLFIIILLHPLSKIITVVYVCLICVINIALAQGLITYWDNVSSVLMRGNGNIGNFEWIIVLGLLIAVSCVLLMMMVQRTFIVKTKSIPFRE